MPRYDFARIEPVWQQYWQQNDTFKTGEFEAGKDKLYALDMFPYPSGSGLHVGHPEGYTATDIVCRYSRMRGKQVLHPMGWDAFGLPAEEHAIKTGTHPAVTTYKNIDTFRRQLQMLGFSYDWSREFATTDEDYYRWTQWIFLELFDTWYDPNCVWTGPDGTTRTGRGRPISELPIPADVQAAGVDAVRRYQDSRRLAYQHEAPVNWCPALGTVLANEEIVDGKSERGGHPVERFPLRQWMLRITSYGDRLINELDDLSWSESIKDMQRNWIGRSTGAEVDFYIGAFDPQPKAQDAQAELSQTNTDASGLPLNDGFTTWKSERATSGFPEKPGDDVLRVYTTRPDTLYGATYMVIAPEHPFVARLTTAEQKDAVDAYVRTASLKSDLDRTDLAKDKTGVFTGSYAINPVNGERVPIWVADYVLVSYGTGAIMAVPAHDLRDWEFARKYDIPIRYVVSPSQDWSREYFDFAEESIGTADAIIELDGIGEPTQLFNQWFNSLQFPEPLRLEFASSRQSESGTTTFVAFRYDTFVYESYVVFRIDQAATASGFAINCDRNDGTPTDEFKAQITAELNSAGLAKGAVNYKLRDWLFSRQRYWGEPFPVWHELDAHGNPTGLMRVDAACELPVILPEMDEFKPTGSPDPMLSNAPDSWLYKTAADGTKLKRETNTMPQWAGSCWYYLRFADPKNSDQFINPEIEKGWLPVDLYVGGAEHAVLHLLYARFWHKVLFDRGHVHTCEPFQKLVNQGMILGEADENGKAEKMSKSRGNVINPDDVVKDYGADSLRLYEMFMGPLEQVKPWSMSGVEGVYRFLARVWRIVTDEDADVVQLNATVQDVAPTDEIERLLHKTIKAVTDDIEKMSFNTAISRMMEFSNALSPLEVRPKSALETLVLLLSPFAPHIAEELWQLLGHEQTLAYAPWPKYDAAKLVESEVEVPVQINGKLRAKVRVPAAADNATIEAAARANETIAANLEGKTIIKSIVVPGRLVNFVVK